MKYYSLRLKKQCMCSHTDLGAGGRDVLLPAASPECKGSRGWALTGAQVIWDGQKEVRETKIIAAGANPALLCVTWVAFARTRVPLRASAGCGSSGATATSSLEPLSSAGRPRQRRRDRRTRAERLGPPPGTRSGTGEEKGQTCQNSSRETPGQGNATVPPTDIPRGNGSGQGTELRSQQRIWGFLSLPFTF